MPDWLKVILLGIVEGVTEFLPISSTGHLIVAAAMLDFGGAVEGTFEIFIQIGAVVAVMFYYRAQLLEQVIRFPSDAAIRRFWLCVAIAFVPSGLIGFLFLKQIEAVLFNPTTVALALIVGGIIFLIMERPGVMPPPRTREALAITPAQALFIGLAQITALVPGVSRSGSSIIGGMLAGLDRAAATQFSFFLAIPTLGIATVYKLLTSLDQIQPSDLFNLILGAVVAGMVAWASIAWLLRYVARNNFVMFGYYRILAGVIILLLVAARML